MRILYLPFSLAAKLISNRLGDKAFNRLWLRLDPAPPPKPGTGETTTGTVVFVEALEAGVRAGIAAGVNHTFARLFHHLIGVWPHQPPVRPNKRTR